MNYLELLKRLKPLSSSKIGPVPHLYALVKWSSHFDVCYVRRIKKLEENSIGVIKDSEYLTRVQCDSKQAYKDGELFVICEEDWLAGIVRRAAAAFAGPRYVYHLAQIDVNCLSGFQIINSVVQSNNGQRHEAQLIKTLIGKL